MAQPAAEIFEELDLRRHLDAFGDDIHAQPPRHVDDRAYDFEILAALFQAIHEAAVDLQRVDGEFVQVGEAGIARAEVVDGNAQSPSP